jgi:hypothetical protein
MFVQAAGCVAGGTGQFAAGGQFAGLAFGCLLPSA